MSQSQIPSLDPAMDTLTAILDTVTVLASQGLVIGTLVHILLSIVLDRPSSAPAAMSSARISASPGKSVNEQKIVATDCL